RLDWNGTISPPIFNGMNFSESELIYYLEDFDNWEDFYANVFVSHPIIGNEYIRLTAISHIKYYEQAPYIVIDSLDELIQNSLQYTDMYDELRLIPSQEFEVKILIEVD